MFKKIKSNGYGYQIGKLPSGKIYVKRSDVKNKIGGKFFDNYKSVEKYYPNLRGKL